MAELIRSLRPGADVDVDESTIKHAIGLAEIVVGQRGTLLYPPGVFCQVRWTYLLGWQNPETGYDCTSVLNLDSVEQLILALAFVEQQAGELEQAPDKSAAEEALDEIAKLSGCPEWDYPGQVVRDVKLLLEQRDAARREVEELRQRPVHPPLTELEREVSKRHVDEAIGVPPYGAELRRREGSRLDEIMAAVQENQERQQQARDSAQQGLPPTAEVRRAVQQLAERWLAPDEKLEAFVRALPHSGVVMMAVLMRNRCVELTRRVVELSRDVRDLQDQLGAGGAG